MNVTCPECSTEFDVPEDALGPRGRRVRCASCRHIWFQEPVAEKPVFSGFSRFDDSLAIEPIPASVHPDADEDDDEEDETKPKGPSFIKAINYGYLARMLLGFALGLAVAGGATYGAAQAGFKPKAIAPVLKLMGIAESAPRGDSFKIENISVRETKDGTDAVITVVMGRLVNVTKTMQDVPSLDVTPVEADGTKAEGVRVKPDQDTLEPGAGVEFGAQIQGSPPVGGKIQILVND